jgi:hypothetical protein
MACLGLHSPRKTTRINHCYDSRNSGCYVERGRCPQHAKIPSGSIGAVVEMGILSTLKRLLMESCLGPEHTDFGKFTFIVLLSGFQKGRDIKAS